MKNIIMATSNLDDIASRLIRCRAVLDAIQMAMEDDPIVNAIAGVGDLLDGINRDLQADIDCAEHEVEKAAGAV